MDYFYAFFWSEKMDIFLVFFRGRMKSTRIEAPTRQSPRARWPAARVRTPARAHCCVCLWYACRILCVRAYCTARRVRCIIHTRGNMRAPLGARARPRTLRASSQRAPGAAPCLEPACLLRGCSVPRASLPALGLLRASSQPACSGAAPGLEPASLLWGCSGPRAARVCPGTRELTRFVSAGRWQALGRRLQRQPRLPVR